jgi:hypothetical protein
VSPRPGEDTDFGVTCTCFTPGGALKGWLVDPAGGRHDDRFPSVADSRGYYSFSLTFVRDYPWIYGTYTYYFQDLTTGIVAAAPFTVLPPGSSTGSP